MRKPRSPRKATPPTTPPAMAPVFVDEEDEEEVFASFASVVRGDARDTNVTPDVNDGDSETADEDDVAEATGTPVRTVLNHSTPLGTPASPLLAHPFVF